MDAHEAQREIFLVQTFIQYKPLSENGKDTFKFEVCFMGDFNAFKDYFYNSLHSSVFSSQLRVISGHIRILLSLIMSSVHES